MNPVDSSFAGRIVMTVISMVWRELRRWKGYGRMGAGRYCFFPSVVKGKTAQPVPIAEAQKACQKANETD